MSNKRNALGRGLSALLENAETDITSKHDSTGNQALAGGIAFLPIASIEANPFQPRTDFENEALNDLAASIKEQGIIQPVTVRKLGYDKFQLISGERRFRASQIAGLTEIPAYVRIANDQAMLEMALVENIQRENLNPIEISISYKRLIEECKLTQEELSQRVGKNRTTVTNFLRLLKLPAEIQLAIRDGRVSMSHARAIVGIEDSEAQLKIFNEILNSNLSVRNVEDFARQASKNKIKEKTKKAEKATPSMRQIEITRELSDRLETKVDVMKDKSGSGKIVINYYSEHDLERILALIQL
jgi:ParB family chromosome partitioning protein